MSHNFDGWGIFPKDWYICVILQEKLTIKDIIEPNLRALVQ